METILFRHVITIDSTLKLEHDCYKMAFEDKNGKNYKAFEFLGNHKSKHYTRYVCIPKINTVVTANITGYILSFEFWTENETTVLSADIENQICKLIQDEANRLKRLLSNVSVSKNYFKTIS